MIMQVLPLLVFTTFAGTAAGAYALMAVVGGCGDCKRPWLFPLVCLVLLGVGLCGTLAHLGQPLRFANGLSNPASGISQEAYWSIAFGVVLVADTVFSKVKGAVLRPLRWAGAVVAVGLVVVTGLAYHDCLGLPAWSGAATVPLFVIGDLALGLGLYALMDRASWAEGLTAAVVAATAVAFAAVLVGYGLYLVRLGMDWTAFLVAAGLLVAAAGVVGVSARAGKLPAAAASAAVCALLVVGVVVSRYVFFAAGVAV